MRNRGWMLAGLAAAVSVSMTVAASAAVLIDVDKTIQQMTVSVELVERGDQGATLKGKGEADGQSTVSARITLATYNLADRDPALRSADEGIVRQLRDHAMLLRAGATAPALLEGPGVS